jgi:hypothetical protein
MVAVRCQNDCDSVMLKAGGFWEPGSRRWLIERRRIGPVISALERATDSLFRRAAAWIALRSRVPSNSLRRVTQPRFTGIAQREYSIDK